MIIRRFTPEDCEKVSDLIVKTLREVNIKDYSEEYIENLIQRMQPKDILDRAKGTHFYVICEEDRIVGCGAIGPYWDKVDESCFFTIFVLPECQGRGIGKMIIEALERDELFLRAKRIEVPASINRSTLLYEIGIHI